MLSALGIALEIAGALGVFLLGMKMMSESLQQVAGSRMKTLLGHMTSTRLSGVLTGLLITCVVQSSSATTVMVVSFVNAGLMTLLQAIGVIFGANIGTTLTGWIVALLGFKVKLSAYALPAVGVGFGMTFAKNAKVQQWGEALTGFGLLFLGLGLLKNSVPEIGDPEQLAWVQALSSYGFGSVLIFVLIGTGLTVVLQSSSATMTFTLTLAALGWLPYDAAAAMVLGENIGTTATANLAAIGATPAAKRAARAHFLFNVFGVVWALALMKIYLLPTVDFLVPGDPNVDFNAIQGDEAATAAAAGAVTTHLAGFHTLFNLTNTLLMLPMASRLAAVVTRWVPEPLVPSAVSLKHLSPALVATPDLMLVAVGRELEELTATVRGMFDDAVKLLRPGQEGADELTTSVLAREDATDLVEREITAHLALITRESTSADTAREITVLVQNTHNLERIADHCAVLARIAQRMRADDRRFSESDVAELDELSRLVAQALDYLGSYLRNGGDPRHAEEIEEHIDQMRRILRGRHIAQLQASTEDPLLALAFLDTITHLEEIGDRTVSIVRRTEASRAA